MYQAMDYQEVGNFCSLVVISMNEGIRTGDLAEHMKRFEVWGSIVDSMPLIAVD